MSLDAVYQAARVYRAARTDAARVHRNETVKAAHAAGYSLAAIADASGVTKERVRQIVYDNKPPRRSPWPTATKSAPE